MKEVIKISEWNIQNYPDIFKIKNNKLICNNTTADKIKIEYKKNFKNYQQKG